MPRSASPSTSADSGAHATGPGVAARRRRGRWELAVVGVAGAVVLAAFALSRREDGASALPGASTLPDPRVSPSPALEDASARAEAPSRSPSPSRAGEHAEALAPLAAPRPKPRERWKESEFYSEFRALATEAELHAALERALGAGRPAAESFAALRVAFDALGERAESYFLRSAVELTVAPAPGTESVARASIHWLGSRAKEAPSARAVLEGICFAPEVDSELRAASACALLLAAPEADLPRLEGRFARQNDEQVALSAAAVLRDRLAGVDRATHQEHQE